MARLNPTHAEVIAEKISMNVVADGAIDATTTRLPFRLGRRGDYTTQLPTITTAVMVRAIVREAILTALARAVEDHLVADYLRSPEFRHVTNKDLAAMADKIQGVNRPSAGNADPGPTGSPGTGAAYVARADDKPSADRPSESSRHWIGNELHSRPMADLELRALGVELALERVRLAEEALRSAARSAASLAMGIAGGAR